ncbi:hypothetical protein GCM10011452_09020 [Gemmobacter lanyuensis]|uniref:Uncharacterized protein n=1 Tax=Gemmobacter lanyuensis TaxID=1054497 RepID=A0A918INZ9_9RHOB|nr:hypothetical protein [Gemmobacter lanyuensis]GGW23879.1 hypothetical protein GCM10011452_09020 [Gemmobacter lanyuensis]
MGPLACTTCRMIRRFVLAFGGGAFLAYQLTGTMPFQATASDEVWNGLMWVAVFFAFMSVFMRMRQMRARWKR